MLSYLLFLSVQKHTQNGRHTWHTQNVLLQICFCFHFLVYSSIHRTKNPLSSNNRLRCHATRSSITSSFLEKM